MLVLEHYLERACEKLHRNPKLPRQIGLVVRRLECVPQGIGVTDQSISRIKRLRNVETCKTPFAAFRVGNLIVAVQACCHVLCIANAIKGQLLDHRTRDDPYLARDPRPATNASSANVT